MCSAWISARSTSSSVVISLIEPQSMEQIRYLMPVAGTGDDRAVKVGASERRHLVPTITRYRRRWAALAVLLTAEAMNLLDATIVQVAGPAIHTELPGPAADIPWFRAAYPLPFAVFRFTGGGPGGTYCPGPDVQSAISRP